MIKTDDIKIILDSVRGEWSKVTAEDVAFAALCDTFEDKNFAYRIAYGKKGDGDALYETPRFKKMLVALEPFGVGVVNVTAITKEQNKNDLIKLLERVQMLGESKAIDIKDALKMEGDLRVKLNDKFEMEESQKQKRIIVVPSKHDIVCPMTHRECNYWPTKKACCTHFGLIDPMETKVEINNTDSDE